MDYPMKEPSDMLFHSCIIQSSKNQRKEPHRSLKTIFFKASAAIIFHLHPFRH